MANRSQYKNLELPISTERYSIDVFNQNNQIIDEELHKLDLKNIEQDNNLKTIQTGFDNHKIDKENPHEVTASQIGLSKVENKSSEDIRKEITKENVTDALGYIPYTPDEINNKFSELLTKEELQKYAQPKISGFELKKITVQATEPETIEDGEIVFVYEE